MRSRPVRVAAMLVLALVAGLVTVSGAEAKKGGKSATATATNVPIATPAAGVVKATTEVPLEVGKKFKKQVAGKLEITTQMTGSAATYLEEISMKLISPQGRSVYLEAPPRFMGGANQSYGPLTETPDSPFFTCDGPAGTCTNPFGQLQPPFAGTIGNFDLAYFFAAKMRGTWILRVLDFAAPRSGVLNLATLKIKPAKPIE